MGRIQSEINSAIGMVGQLMGLGKFIKANQEAQAANQAAQAEFLKRSDPEYLKEQKKNELTNQLKESVDSLREGIKNNIEYENSQGENAPVDVLESAEKKNLLIGKKNKAIIKNILKQNPDLIDEGDFVYADMTLDEYDAYNPYDDSGYYKDRETRINELRKVGDNAEADKIEESLRKDREAAEKVRKAQAEAKAKREAEEARKAEEEARKAEEARRKARAAAKAKREASKAAKLTREAVSQLKLYDQYGEVINNGKQK